MRSTRPCSVALVERRVLGARAQLLAVDHPGLGRVEHDEIGRRAGSSTPPGRPSSAGGIDGQRLAAAPAAARPRRVMQLERGGQQRLEADRAVGGFRERAALHVGVLGIVARHDDVDLAGGERRAPAPPGPPPSAAAAQLEERAVGADVGLVQRQVVHRHAARDRQLARLGCADHGEALGVRDGGRVIAPAGHLDEADVALEHDDLGHLGAPGRPSLAEVGPEFIAPPAAR